jgi:hypothetical protein
MMYYKNLIVLVFCIFGVAQAYNMNNFPIIKRLFDRRNQNNYSKKSYLENNANNYVVYKIILDEMASKIVGPKKNNTGFGNK